MPIHVIVCCQLLSQKIESDDNMFLNEMSIACAMLRPKKQQPEIPIILPTLNYQATVFHIFIFMQIFTKVCYFMQIFT